MSDRKYSQRGYQDSEKPARERGPQAPPPPKKEGPRGRGLGAPTETVYACPQCSAQLPLATPIEASSTCPKCRAALHSCANCRFFDPSTRFECRQDIPARIANKRAANACEQFDARTVQTHAREAAKGDPKDPRSAFDALFKL
jgi:hypothetical protein